MIYLTEAIKRLYDELKPVPSEHWIITRNELLRWVRELFLTGQVAIQARLAERLDDENCVLGSVEKIEPYPDLTFGYGGRTGDEVRLWKMRERQKLPLVEWREIAITAEDFDWLRHRLHEQDAQDEAASVSETNSKEGSTKRKLRTEVKKAMYESWYGMVPEYLRKEDGTRRLRKDIAKKIASDQRARDPLTNHPPDWQSVIRRLDSTHPGWAEKS